MQSCSERAICFLTLLSSGEQCRAGSYWPRNGYAPRNAWVDHHNDSKELVAGSETADQDKIADEREPSDEEARESALCL